jgi:iron complex transport system substrate-binding protein
MTAQTRILGSAQRACLLVTVLLTCLCACHSRSTISQTKPDRESGGSGYPRTLRDSSGNDVTIKARPVRIVSQTLATDEILWDICAHERIVGVSKFGRDPKYSPIASELQAARVTSILGAEDILQLQPDLIFVASYSLAETVENLRAAGATVFRFANFDSIEKIQENIRLVGQAVAEEANVEKLIAQMNADLAAVKARIPAKGAPPRVLSFHPSGNTAGADTSFDAIARAVGAVNVVAQQGLRGHLKISAEQVAEWQPDFIITEAEAGKAEEATQRLLDNPVIATTTAAHNGRIIVLNRPYLLAVSQYITRAVSELADALYQKPPPASR